MSAVIEKTRTLLDTMERLQEAQDSGLGDRSTISLAMEGVGERLRAALEGICPICHGTGKVDYPGTWEQDDPADDVDCELCRGTGQIDPRWAKAIKTEMYCGDCGKWHKVAEAPDNLYSLLCIHCWHRAVREKVTA
jgi:DnaJ-class molecular chaperone